MSDLFKAAAVWGNPGGRRALAKRLVMMLPEHRVYTESFAGAGSVFFAKARADVEVLNDVDVDAMDAYRAIKSISKSELASLASKSWTGGVSTWDSIQAATPGNRVERLHKFLYLTFFSQGKKRGAPFNSSLIGHDAKGILKRVIQAHDRLKGVHLESGDYAETIKKYDAGDALHFMDPPADGVDQDAMFALLKSLKGRFLLVSGGLKQGDLGAFHVRKVGRFKPGEGQEDAPGNLIITNFEIARKSLGGWFWLMDLTKAFPGGPPEAGLHLHTLHREKEKTAKDGRHRHAFRLPDGSIVWSDEDGAHEHRLDEYDYIGGGAHAHRLAIPGAGMEGADLELFTSADGSHHGHQQQSTHTAFDGVHTHTLQLGAELLCSLTGKDLWEMDGKPEQAQNPDAPPASALAAMTMNKAGPGRHLDDPFVIGKVNVAADGDIYIESQDPAAAVTAALAKRLPSQLAAATRVMAGRPPLDHVTVAEVIIRPTDDRVAKATDLDMDARVASRGDLFCALDAAGIEVGRFRSRLLAEQVVGEVATMRSEDGIPSVLSWSSVESGAMPPPGMSMLPATLERQVPEHLRFWKMSGERARNARDALVDSGFADAIMEFDGDLAAAKTTISMAKASDLIHAPAQPSGLEEVVAELAGAECGVWESKDLPAEDLQHDGPVFVPASVSAGWAGAGMLQDAIERFAKHSAGALIACPDSVAARSAMAAAGNVMQIRRAACANMVFHATDSSLAKASFVRRLADIPMSIAFESQTTFTLGKSAGGTYLVVGQNAFLLSKSLDGGASFASLVETPSDMDIIDQGAALAKDDGVFRMFRLRGETLSGEFSARPCGSTWRVIKDVMPLDEIRMRSLHKDADKDEQFVLGIVLEPEEVDAHGDVISAAEIRASAHDYMIRSRKVKLQHRTRTSQVAVVQSYTAPHELNFGSQTVKADTWLMGMLVLESKLWQRVLADEFTGLSIGGVGIKEPIA